MLLTVQNTTLLIVLVVMLITILMQVFALTEIVKHKIEFRQKTALLDKETRELKNNLIKYESIFKQFETSTQEVKVINSENLNTLLISLKHCLDLKDFRFDFKTIVKVDFISEIQIVSFNNYDIKETLKLRRTLKYEGVSNCPLSICKTILSELHNNSISLTEYTGKSIKIERVNNILTISEHNNV